MEHTTYTCLYCGNAAHNFPEVHDCPVQALAQEESLARYRIFKEAFDRMDTEEQRFPGPISAEQAKECLFWVAQNRYINGLDKMIEIQIVKQFIRENTPEVAS